MNVIKLKALAKVINEDVVKEAFIGKIITLGYVEPLLPQEVFKYYPLNEYDYRLDSGIIEYVVANMEELMNNLEPGVNINKVSTEQFNECMQLTSSDYELITVCKRNEEWIVYHMNKRALMKYFILNISLEGGELNIKVKSNTKPSHNAKLKVAYILGCDVPVDFIIDVYSSVYVEYFSEYKFKLPEPIDVVNALINNIGKYRNFLKLYTTDYYIYELTMTGYIIELENEGQRVRVNVNGETVLTGNQIKGGNLYEITNIMLDKLSELKIGLDMIELYSCSLDELLRRAISSLRESVRL
ncbi:hypothetical protein [Caldivirga maquilingensis]|uniref:Uncharacterized protein n=1 Tax=Caldivirga maquilingensis (strain ATCC 700844 / DSM 13496 / JCM 10307 / IC-167) TaxID=397948 RepID=A8MDW7_CALMQ|nr:hypothetical protein [Caldivirga maquilingensis]ABW01973.1 hypothetical protein Cmaq_1146 [Caldivirga maquilingensis IC-167]